jgi:hypothetical protein
MTTAYAKPQPGMRLQADLPDLDKAEADLYDIQEQENQPAE